MLALLIASFAVQASPVQSGNGIIGVWIGESICVNLAIAPHCKNEKIRYSFKAGANTVEPTHLVAEKFVSGRYEVMYEMDFAIDPKSKTWFHDFDSAQGKCRWQYRVSGNRLVGEVILLGSGSPLRKVAAIQNGVTATP